MLHERHFHEPALGEAAYVGKGAIYRRFSGKNDLFFHLATQGASNSAKP